MFTKLLEGVDKKLVRNLVILHTLVIAVSNYLAGPAFHLSLFPGWNNPILGDFEIMAAAFTFPIVVVATDLTVRLVGKQAGRAVVALAVIPAIIGSVLVIGLTGAPWEIAQRIGIASGVAYGIGTMLDVYVFQYVREKYSEAWWAAPAISTIAANFIDTYAFVLTAFPGEIGLAFNQTMVKVVVGLIVFLPTYGLLLSFLKDKVDVGLAPKEEAPKKRGRKKKTS